MAYKSTTKGIIKGAKKDVLVIGGFEDESVLLDVYKLKEIKELHFIYLEFMDSKSFKWSFFSDKLDTVIIGKRNPGFKYSKKELINSNLLYILKDMPASVKTVELRWLNCYEPETLCYISHNIETLTIRTDYSDPEHKINILLENLPLKLKCLVIYSEFVPCLLNLPPKIEKIHLIIEDLKKDSSKEKIAEVMTNINIVASLKKIKINNVVVLE